MRARQFPADWKHGEQRQLGSTRSSTLVPVSIGCLPSPALPGPREFPYTKDADIQQNPLCSLPSSPPPAAGAPRGGNWFQGGWQEGTGAAEDLATHQLDNQLMKSRVDCVLGLDLVFAALPYLTGQLATASP